MSVVRNVLIVSASIGSGHTQAAKAVKAELKRQHPQSNAIVVDFFAGDSFSLTHFAKVTYLKMIDSFPHVYDVLYRRSKASQEGTAVRDAVSWILKKRMLRLVEEHKPDLIVFTHPFPCGAACRLKRKGKLNVPLAGVITDYAIHHLWVYDEVDIYFVAAEAMAATLGEQGVPRERIQITGIPVGSAFGQVTKQVADQTEPTILVMGGGLGLGALEEVLLQLDTIEEACRFIVVTGRNSRLRKGLQRQSATMKHPLLVMGYTQRIPELMACSQLLITKPGALTCSEAMAAGLPMVLVNAIPGHEEDNAAYLHRHGAAIWVKEKAGLSTVVKELLGNREQMETLRQQAWKLGKPDAAGYIVQHLKCFGINAI